MYQKETRHAKRKWIKIILLLVPLCLVVLLMAFSNALLNCWMLLIEPNYIIPKESNIFQFEVNQMNEGSGDWWIYGQDNKNYYFFYGLELLPYITFSKNDARACSDFDKLNINTWCGKFAEQIKSKDTTVTYAELLDDGCGVLLYRSNYPDVLFFVRLSDSSLYELDSIVDFNHDFAVYRTETELVEMKAALAKALIAKRKACGETQVTAAILAKTSQSRYAKVEHADSSVSLELMIKMFFALGATKKELIRTLSA